VFVIRAFMFVRRTFLSAYCPRKVRFVHRGNTKLFAQISGTISTIHIVLTGIKCAKLLEKS